MNGIHEVAGSIPAWSTNSFFSFESDGKPRLREVALQELAVRRARALSDYMPASGLNAAAIALLKQDSLVVSPDTNALLVATAHDVLEDWAILQWIEEPHLMDETAFKALSSAHCPLAPPAL